MDKAVKLRAFAQDMKEGYQLVKEKRDEEAKEKLKPYIELMRKTGTPHLRLFVSYSIAQIRTGEFEEFLQTYQDVREIVPKTKEEEEIKKQLDGFFENVMEELQKEEE
ncbi:hypothetical protein GN156_02730 [bacterium LRH843]|nr:hypothetical protein [bacterium LRH843]